ncbi:MAG TPA: hypothetical protein VE779_09765 [Candidatus Angelobacter sp.]|nr:hypothetical protein [Candidatus Angelobacter sp.]
MRNLIGLLLLTLATSCLWGQQLPSGTLLPVMLDDTINSNKVKPGQEIVAKLRQDVPLPDNGKIKRLAKVTGHIVAVSRESPGQPASLTLQFDKVEIEKDVVTVSTGLRALASMQIVAQVRQPVNTNMSPGTSVWDLNLSLIGGQIAYNGAKIVKAPNGQVVGRVPEPGATLGVPMANPERGCVGPVGNAEQAFWVFSTDACGLYDLKDFTYVSGIGGDAPGKIILKAPKTVEIRGGSAWLLQVN